MSRFETIENSAQSPARIYPGIVAGIKLVGLSALVLLTNPGSLHAFVMLAGRHQWPTLVPFVVIWLLALLALWVAAFDPRLWVRGVMGALVAASTAFAQTYYLIAGAQLSMLDIMSLWNTRHEAGRAMDFYHHQFAIGGLFFAAMWLLCLLPPAGVVWLRRPSRKLLALPLLEIVLIAALFWVKHGASYIPMPSQFNATALGSLLALKLSTENVPVRTPVAWAPGPAVAPKHIVMLMDESLRADYLDFTPGNAYTPHLAALKDQFINFGPAASAGDCSNYSNALVRFGASREDIVASASTNASLFAYAKKAGFRTVYIDAQAGHVTNGNKIQNFMTLYEKNEIDAFYAIDDVPAPQADLNLAAILATELKSEKPVFIYANKNGAHFPYDLAYPPEEAKFHPTMAEAGNDSSAARIASYRNAVAWSVDHFMDVLFTSADLSQTTLIYTSDHSQRFVQGSITHCQTDQVDPRTGYVPLLVHAPEGELRAQFTAAAPLSAGRASHFEIAPTLYRLMGYNAADIAQRYDESLFTGTSRPAAFTSGDIFGVFGNAVQLNPVDLRADYREDKVN